LKEYYKKNQETSISKNC